MGIKKTREVPRRLEGVRRRIEQWRRSRKVRAPIPDPLWAAAVRMAKSYGMNRTARALRLNYYGLKKRVERQAVAAAGASETKDSVPFVELVPFTSAGQCDCLLELENGGAKMQIQLKGITVPGTIRRMVLAALSQTFWNRQP